MDPAEFWEELATIKVGNNGFLDCLNFINLCMYFFVNSYYFINNFGLIFGYFSFMVYVVMWTDLCEPMQLCEVLWSENALLGHLDLLKCILHIFIGINFYIGCLHKNCSVVTRHINILNSSTHNLGPFTVPFPAIILNCCLFPQQLLNQSVP